MAAKRKSLAELYRAVRPAVIDAHQYYSILETAAARGVSESWIRREIREGKLRAKREGRRVLVYGQHIIDLARAEAEGGQS